MLNMGSGQFSFLLFLCFCQLSFSSSIPHPCPKDESISLLKLKKTLTVHHSFDQYSYPTISSWNLSRDCCSWYGVICDEMTGHVIELNLRGSGLAGKIDSNSSLFQLSHLQRLDLSGNDFFNSQISPEFGSFSSLTHLDLYYTSFSGQIPSEISHLSKLQYFKLTTFFDSNKLRLAAHDFKLLLQNLTQLRELDLSFINISSTIPLNFSSHLTTLRLTDTGLYGIIPENLTRLEDLGLGGNSLNGTIPSGMFSLPSLSSIILNYNHLSGQLEDFKSNSLIWIDLSNNQLQGYLPNSIQNQLNLRYLDLSFNNFSGNVDISLFSDLKKLWFFVLSYNSVSVTNEKEVKSTLPESLEYLGLAACEVKELEFLRSAKKLSRLDLSNNKIQGRIPVWAWSNWMVSLRLLNLSHNMLTSVDSIPLQSANAIDLRSNLLQGSLPIPPITTNYFFISQNNLTEEIPSSICNLTSLVMLDLARNNLHGEIPQCLGNITFLQVLDMHNNKLSGNIPTIISNGSSLRSLNLHGNKLEGKIPPSLANCKDLQVLDLGHNHLNDTFPMWLGTLPDLQVLSLRSNKLFGSIQPSRIENMFPKLRIIDLSSNDFLGNLPTGLFQHLKAMRTNEYPSKIAPSYGYYQDSVVVVTKGLELEVVRILFLYTTMDLSNNRFEGHIPSVTGDLIALRMLNFSHNRLQGHIPSSLGNLSVVESLDLSFNQLEGEIPQQLASLTSLEVLKLSHNHLQGCIPKGPQFNTFEINSYEGNDGLHGLPVSEGCGSSSMPETNNTTHMLDEESNYTFLSDFKNGILMGYGSGLIIGFSIAYFMLSSRNSNWLSRITEELEYRIAMKRRKKQRGHHRR